MTTEQTESCPGVGRCHGPIVWCPDCDVASMGPCDMRARGERCSVHPSSGEVRPLLEEARHRVACADQDAGDALVRARSAEATARRLRGEADRLEDDLRRATTEVGHLQAQLTAALADEAGRR